MSSDKEKAFRKYIESNKLENKWDKVTDKGKYTDSKSSRVGTLVGYHIKDSANKDWNELKKDWTKDEKKK